MSSPDLISRTKFGTGCPQQTAQWPNTDLDKRRNQTEEDSLALGLLPQTFIDIVSD